MQPEDYRYWAFISYSHADERWAGWLHRSLEGYRIPERLVGRATPRGTVPKKLFPVFRDRDELAGSSSLGPELQKALGGSRSLIVICSPRSANSRWVNEEIKYFKSLGRADRVFALIVDGEPHALEQGDPELECFPEALRFHVNAAGQVVSSEAIEPIAADARPHGDGKGHAKLKLIAGILGLGFDDLRQREMQARNRRLGIVAALATGVAALTLVLAIQAWYARNDAQRRQRQAEDLIQFMLGDLRHNLEPIGKLNILDAVGDKAMEYFGTLNEGDVTDAVLQSRATALRQVGEIRAKQGKLAEASDAFQEALKLDSALVERHPQDTQALFNVAKSQYSVGYAHYVRGELDLARPWFERKRLNLERLVALEPKDGRWQAELAGAWGDLGGVAQMQGERALAREQFGRARNVQLELVKREPANREYLIGLADIYGWLTHIETSDGKHEAALEQARLQNGLLRQLLELEPEHAEYRHRLASGLLQALYSRSILSPLPPDDRELQEALRLTAGLSILDPSNLTYARMQAVALSYLEDAHVMRHDLAQARTVNARALALSQDLQDRAPDSSEALDDLLSVYLRSAKLAVLGRDRIRAHALIEEALTLLAFGPAAQEKIAPRGLELQLLAQWIASDDPGRVHAAAEARRWKELLLTTKVALKPELMLRYEALNGKAEDAERLAGRLTPVERSHPYLRQFCRDLKLSACSTGAAN